jgi:His-Xaa-Ser system protein HxsD
VGSDSTNQSIASDEQAQEAVLTVDARVYSRDAVLRTLYWFSKDYYCELASEDGAHFSVRLRPRQTVPTLENPRVPDPKTAISELQNALIDAELRVQIQKETAGIRELILAKAFSEAGVLEDIPPKTFDDPVLASKPKDSDASLLKILS